MKNHFKGLDTLRAIAALAVVFSHIELQKSYNGISNLISYTSLRIADGHIAVILFFVLSGFLITYLLVKEKEKTGRISLKKFYLRRIFRIWPLYYLIILLSFLLFNAVYDKTSVFLCLSIFPNIAQSLNLGWPTSPQIWSIGVEEQFYLIWPILVILIPDKRKIWFLIIFFIGYSLLPHLLGFINNRTFESVDFGNIMTGFFYGSKFNSMSFGALLGYMYAKKHKMINLLYNKFIIYPSIIISFGLWSIGYEFKYFSDEIYSILFGIVILNLATNVNLKLNFDTKISGFLGKISYGIYMYHWIILLLCMKYIPYSNFENKIVYHVVLYIAGIGGTIFISWISFISYEKFFLKLKERFET
jgi:peptidoglycan/LPS O-acetylase OafA/YrhL